MPRRRLVVVLLVLLSLLVPAGLQAQGAGGAPPCLDASDDAVRFSLPVEGEDATGFYALPARAPRGIVVFSHGYGHSSFSWIHHLKRVAAELDVVAVAMDGRGLRSTGRFRSAPFEHTPITTGWPVHAAAEDGVAAARHFSDRCPSAKTIVNYGVSMGGNTSGLMAAEGATRRDGRTPLFDYWISVEGVSNVISTYLGARAASPQAHRDIRAEMGGEIEDPAAQDRYRRAAIVTRAADIAAAGVKGVVLVHGYEDGLVGYEQSEQMRAALIRAGVPVQLFSVATKTQPEGDTTYSSYVGRPIDRSYSSPLAGHASELSTTHIVGTTGFDRLTAIFRGQPPTCTRQHLVDGALRTVVPAPAAC